ncbi:MAG: hypothetical protein MUC43_14795 [Pirellula sp.]|jgi:hypothetical protein|nr:hypothetical protein [Pirellula sp.]
MVRYRVSQLLADQSLEIEDLATTQQELYGSAKFDREDRVGSRWSVSAVNHFTGRSLSITHKSLLVVKPVVDISMGRYYL